MFSALLNAQNIVSSTVPGTPTIGASSSGDKSFTINWTTPSSDGGSAITGYYVRNSTNNGASWSTPILVGVVTTYNWSGNAVIYNGNTYIGQVAAVNAIGTGSYSSSSVGRVPTFAAPSCSVTGQAGYPTTADPLRRPLTVTINPTACVNYSYTQVYLYSSPYEDFGNYSSYVQASSGGAGVLFVTSSSATGQTGNVYSIYQQNVVQGNQYYLTGASITYYVYVVTYNNDGYGVASSVASFTTAALQSYYTFGGYSSATGTFTVTGNTFQQTSAYAIPNNDTQITSLTVNAASNGTVTICTSGRYFIAYFSGATTGTFSQSLTGLQAPWSTNSGTTVRSLGWNVADTGFNCVNCGKIRINGAGSIGTWATNQRTNVTVSITGQTRTLNYY